MRRAMQPGSLGRADIDPNAQCTGEIAHRNCRLIWISQPIGETDTFGVLQAVRKNARQQVFLRLRRMTRHAQIQGQIDTAVRIGEFDLEVINSRAERNDPS
jgi:hypothetical protein